VTAIRLVRDELAKIGYSVVVNDYVFSDVFASSPRDCTVPLAAFTHTPPSYRNAALAVVEVEQGTGGEIPDDYRALGAPLLIAIDQQQVTVWQVRYGDRPRALRHAGLDQLGTLFFENRDDWAPQRIHAAKSFGQLDRSRQLDFVDAGLLPAIEGQIHGKLDRLLNETLADVVRVKVARRGDPTDQRVLFRTIFRLLAAKVLQDRGHELSAMWNLDDIDSVLKGISNYYKLPSLPGEGGSFRGTVFEPAWLRLRKGINFRNISSDDLAFVYENTLVTRDTRKLFGTHSTPRAVAEYIVNRLELWRDDPETLTVYEPFAGAGVFMVAALRLIGDLLPVEMAEPDRHQFLVDRIYGDEIEPFAVEVAMLSLILADYPNENGWAISQADLFEKATLLERARGAKVILCNPPFEPFNAGERLRYPEASARSPFKPIVALDSVLDARPLALGFVLPEPFIGGKQYGPQRRRVEKLYKEIEVVALPDRVFKESMIRSSLLIAREPRAEGEAIASLRSTTVRASDRDRFLKTGEVSETRTKTRPLGRAPGELWIKELEEIWECLVGLPTVESVAEVHKGLEWRGGQSNAVSTEKRDGFRPGIHSANAVHVLALGKPVNLDSRPESVAKRTAALKRPWHRPKLLTNAARLSRGPWCFAAAVDRNGLLASQQLFGVWAKEGSNGPSLAALCALLNSPLAVAHIASHSPPDRIRAAAINAVPIPLELPAALDELVQSYVAILREQTDLFADALGERANKALNDIDAAILEAYDLPPRLERTLLEYFRGDERPTLHRWTHWFPVGFNPFIPLHEYISAEYHRSAGQWVIEVFTPLPESEVVALRKCLD
jgi:hypothetical protein